MWTLTANVEIVETTLHTQTTVEGYLMDKSRQKNHYLMCVHCLIDCSNVNISFLEWKKQKIMTLYLIGINTCTNYVHAHAKYVKMLIKTITKFSNVIGYQQPDLSINWTVYASCL